MWSVKTYSGAKLASYLFDRHKTKKGDKISELFINTQSNTKKITEAVKEGATLAECTNIARDLVNEPSNVIYPETLAKEAVKFSKKYGFSAEIFEEKEIEKLKMNAFLAVARAAEKRPRLIVLKYMGDPSSKEITALIGKGLTYDTGGLALKPATGMVTMKCDMGGSAAVIGAISAMKGTICQVKSPGCLNLIGGNAYRNGDIIGSMAGKNIEVLNTDAEGRLTLIDAVTYAIRKQKATKIVDIATLTGAVMVALGNSVTGVVSNNDKFFKQLEKASRSSGEQVWRLPNYPEYTNEYIGVGGKLYRQGLIMMNEFVTQCGRDCVPMIWFQDTSGIDVGDIAEKAELLGLGQSLIYSIEQTNLPMMLVVLRKGTAAAHYVMGGPTANNNTAFTLGTPTTEIYVMHGETAAAASYARRLVKEKDAGNPLGPVIDKMNEMVKHYEDTSRPFYCAKTGFVDEVVRFEEMRRYMVAFANGAYQNPRSICPRHHMMLPRLIRSQIVTGLPRPK